MVWNTLTNINLYENLLEEREQKNYQMTQEYVKIENLCRTCLREVTDGSNLFKDFEIGSIPINMDGKYLKLIDMLAAFTNLKVDCEDKLPKQICSNCIQNVSGAYFFRLQCYKAEKTLLRLLKAIDVNSEESNKINSEVNLYKVDITNKAVEELVQITGDTETENGTDINSLEVEYNECKVGPYNDVYIEDEEIYLEETLEISDDQVVANESDRCKADSDSRSINNETITEIRKVGNRCNDCDLPFVRKKDLADHIRTVHPYSKIFECEVCHSRCSNTQTLKRHMKIHQADQKNKLCTFCGKCFTRADDLKRHIRIHTGERPYACTKCPKRYKQTSELKEHVATHTQERVYVCTVCGKCLLTRNGHYVHMKVHLGVKNHVCMICNNRYVTSGELASHIRHIHDKKKPYSCTFDNCQRSFSTKLSLDIHQRAHTGLRPFICSTCGKGLATASSLSEHIRIHTGEKKNICNLCDRAFSNSQSLKKHARIHIQNQQKNDKKMRNVTLLASETLGSKSINRQIPGPRKCSNRNTKIENGDIANITETEECGDTYTGKNHDFHQLQEKQYDIVFVDNPNEVIIGENIKYGTQFREERVIIEYFEK